MSSFGAAAVTEPVLPGYECQMNENAAAHSFEKLSSSATELEELDSSRLASLPSLFKEGVKVEQLCTSQSESHSYRCTAAFQFISEGGQLQYAMRNNFKPVSLNASLFPIANLRIQAAMKLVLSHLNKTYAENPSNSLVKNLTSCKFVTPWNQKQCLLTFSYGEQIENVEEFNALGSEMLTTCKLTSITGRPKGKEYILGVQPRVLSDEIFVGLNESVSVKYEKPEDAFQHPNETTMKKALKWILEKMVVISDSMMKVEGRKLKLLELYCGCGAHTVAIGKCSGETVFEKIVAVEIDQRLVDACVHNAELNGLAELISVMKADAAQVAKNF